MQIISHPINLLPELESQPLKCGVEIDLRCHEDDLVLTHDPFGHHRNNLLTFEAFLHSWGESSGTLIVNVKSEGIEEKCIELLNKYGVKNWFFLDLSMPYLVKYGRIAKANLLMGFTPSNLAVRFSDFEPIEYALSFRHMAKWVWVDWFESIALTKDNYSKLIDAGFSVCLVSPELQGKGIDLIEFYRKHIELNEFTISAVCTKRPDLWK